MRFQFRCWECTLPYMLRVTRARGRRSMQGQCSATGIHVPRSFPARPRVRLANRVCLKHSAPFIMISLFSSSSSFFPFPSLSSSSPSSLLPRHLNCRLFNHRSSRTLVPSRVWCCHTKISSDPRTSARRLSLLTETKQKLRGPRRPKAKSPRKSLHSIKARFLDFRLRTLSRSNRSSPFDCACASLPHSSHARLDSARFPFSCSSSIYTTRRLVSRSPGIYRSRAQQDFANRAAGVIPSGGTASASHRPSATQLLSRSCCASLNSRAYGHETHRKRDAWATPRPSHVIFQTWRVRPDYPHHLSCRWIHGLRCMAHRLACLGAVLSDRPRPDITDPAALLHHLQLEDFASGMDCK